MEGLLEGRIVHFIDYNRVHLAAVVVGVIDPKQGEVDLHVFPSRLNGGYVVWGCGHDAGAAAVNTWHWMERA